MFIFNLCKLHTSIYNSALTGNKIITRKQDQHPNKRPSSPSTKHQHQSLKVKSTGLPPLYTTELCTHPPNYKHPQSSLLPPNPSPSTSLLASLIKNPYHATVGATVAACHRLCASIAPPSGGKSSNSKLIASTSHVTINPGVAAQSCFSRA